MSRRWLGYTRVSSAVLALCSASLPAALRADDPPSRVARLSFLSGAVSFRPGSVEDWGDASLNYPLTAGDHLWTDQDARAELHIGSTAVRLGPFTAFNFLNLDDRTVQMRIAQGALEIRLRNLGPSDLYEIDTPNAAVTLLRPGTYRIDVDTAGDSTGITIREGEAEVTSDGATFPVLARQTAVVAGVDAPAYDVFNALPPDDWEGWCAARDRREDAVQSARYVSRDMDGYEDLDGYGVWQSSDEYGPVWVPQGVGPDWAPYRYGHWAWVDPWGWTWIDDAPWGFAPFHYGRWVRTGYGWAWVPGRVVARPVYAPALVVFVGGSGWSASLNLGGGRGVAWFPLGPNEAYVPAYTSSPSYVRNVNVTNVNVTNINVTNINETNVHYVNRDVPNAVTAVPQETMTQSRPVAPVAVHVPRANLRASQILGTAPPVAPTSQSIIGPHGQRAVARPSATIFARPVVAKSEPPPPPVRFDLERQRLAGTPGRPLDEATRNQLRSRAPVSPNAPVFRPAAAGQGATLKPARAGLPLTRPATPPAWSTRHPNPTPAPPSVPPNSPAPAPAPAPRPVAPPRNDRPPVAHAGARPGAEQPSVNQSHPGAAPGVPPAKPPEASRPRQEQPQPAERKPRTPRDSVDQRRGRDTGGKGRPDDTERPRDNRP
ncbi:MAG TPA: DUF6600 domain-containing protein [Gemmatimonadales bacterium]|nr:DUF6600 domain-containing protein [Gemmatimonadales bacterium]